MLRVGLTGGLGSGKSTAAAMLAELGAHVVSSDAIGRALMQPGEAVFTAIVEQFGRGVLVPEGARAGELDRARLAELAFEGGRVEELNAIVHPVVIAQQAELAEAIAAREPEAVFVLESALLFETQHGGVDGWRRRFDRVVVVTAPDALKVARFIARDGSGDAEGRAEEARRRLLRQMPDAEKVARADWVLRNEGSVEELQVQVEALWPQMLEEARARA